MPELHPRCASGKARGWPHSDCSWVRECRLGPRAQPRDTAVCAPKPECGPPHRGARKPPRSLLCSAPTPDTLKMPGFRGHECCADGLRGGGLEKPSN